MQKSNQSMILYCFSPLVMATTFLLEWILAIVSLIRIRKSLFAQLSVILLLLLATFQLAEYLICTQTPSLLWARVGLVAITLLPPLGLHLVSLFSGRYHLTWLGYGLAGFFILAFLFWPGVTGRPTCGGNYVVLHTNYPVAIAYGYYYLGYLLLALWAALRLYQTSHNPDLRKLLLWMILGYLSFMVPMAIVYLVSPAARAAVPSIMCGFALLLAFILSFKILPLYEVWITGQQATSQITRRSGK